MRITDIIRGVLDLVDQGDQTQPEVVAIPPSTGLSIDVSDTNTCSACGTEPCTCEQNAEPDLLAIIQQLAGLESPEAEYANEPCEVVAPIGASFPGGDDVHSRKNPADIRTNAPSMYPGFQAGAR
jgi:hypothetical protein